MILFAEQYLFKNAGFFPFIGLQIDFFQKKCIKVSWFDQLGVVSVNKNDTLIKFRYKINVYSLKKKSFVTLYLCFCWPKNTICCLSYSWGVLGVVTLVTVTFYLFFGPCIYIVNDFSQQKSINKQKDNHQRFNLIPNLQHLNTFDMICNAQVKNGDEISKTCLSLILIKFVSEVVFIKQSLQVKSFELGLTTLTAKLSIKKTGLLGLITSPVTSFNTHFWTLSD